MRQTPLAVGLLVSVNYHSSMAEFTCASAILWNGALELQITSAHQEESSDSSA